VPGIAPKAARNRRRQGAANIRSGGPLPHGASCATLNDTNAAQNISNLTKHINSYTKPKNTDVRTYYRLNHLNAREKIDS